MTTNDGEWLNIVKERLKFFSTIIGCILIDSGFIGIWAIIDQAYHKYVVEWLKTWFESTLVNEYVFPGIKGLFDVVTLAIVAIFLYVDFRRIARKLLEIAKEGSKAENLRLEPRELRQPDDAIHLGDTNKSEKSEVEHNERSV